MRRLIAPILLSPADKSSNIQSAKELLSCGQADKRKKVRLFWGTKSPEMTPYKDIIPEWEARGVQVVSVYSADGNGYVQDVFEQVMPLFDHGYWRFQQTTSAHNVTTSKAS